jgi:hypothetical protein
MNSCSSNVFFIETDIHVQMALNLASILLRACEGHSNFGTIYCVLLVGVHYVFWCSLVMCDMFVKLVLSNYMFAT